MADTKGNKPGHGVDPTIDDRYERTDARHSAIVLWVIVITVGAVLSAFAVFYYYKYANHRIEERNRAGSDLPGPRAALSDDTPQLQLAPQIDLATYRAVEKATLNSYGWVSKEGGVARIPIRRAMELMLERNPAAAVADAATTGTAPDTGGDLPQDSSGGRTSWNFQR